jgi:ABC-type bacteriocin/lantibiotic exporter with double-glycine peptidase domain
VVGVLALSTALQLAAFIAPLQMQLIVDQAIAQTDHDLLVVIALAFAALVLIHGAIEALRDWALRIFGHLLSFQIPGNLVRHLLRLPSDFFEKRHVGDIISRLGSVRPIQEAITKGVASSVIDGVMAFIAGAILFFYSTTLALIVFAAVLLNLAMSLALLASMNGRMQHRYFTQPPRDKPDLSAERDYGPADCAGDLRRGPVDPLEPGLLRWNAVPVLGVSADFHRSLSGARQTARRISPPHAER